MRQLSGVVPKMAANPSPSHSKGVASTAGVIHCSLSMQTYAVEKTLSQRKKEEFPHGHQKSSHYKSKHHFLPTCCDPSGTAACSWKSHQAQQWCTKSPETGRGWSATFESLHLPDMSCSGWQWPATSRCHSDFGQLPSASSPSASSQNELPSWVP